MSKLSKLLAINFNEQSVEISPPLDGIEADAFVLIEGYGGLKGIYRITKPLTATTFKIDAKHPNIGDRKGSINFSGDYPTIKLCKLPDPESARRAIIDAHYNDLDNYALLLAEVSTATKSPEESPRPASATSAENPLNPKTTEASAKGKGKSVKTKK